MKAKESKLSFKLANLPEDKQELVIDLKSLRESRNWSLEDLHLRTKIPVKHLHALELGRRDFLPPINVRAFLRTLGRTYEIDWIKLEPPAADDEGNVEIISLDDVTNDGEQSAEGHWASPIVDSYLKVKRSIRRIFNRDRD